MRAVPFDSPGKGVLELPEISVSFSSVNSKREDFEPTSVLDTQRSPSPPTSSLGCSAGVAAFSDDPWPQEDLSAAGKVTDSGSRKEDWAADLQPIPSSLEIGGGKCGLGMEEDWENMLSSSPGHEHSLFRWVMGDFEDPLKHLLEPGAPINHSMHVNESMNMLTSSMATTGTDLVPLNSYSGGKMVADSNEMQSFKGSPMGGNNNWSNQMNPIFSPDHGNKNNLNLPVQQSLHPGLLYHDQEPQNFNPHHQQQLPHANQSPALALPICYGQQEHDPFPHRAKRLHSSVHISNTPFAQSGEEAFLRRQQQEERFPNVVLPLHLQHRKPKVGDEASMAHLQQQQQALVDQLFRAAELVGAGNPTHAQGILARLNHQLPSPVGKPLQRAAFYFKEALQLLLNPTPKAPFSHLDAAFKISAYKVFLETSPMLQFAHFTSNQVLLEALEGFNQIHILDFDMGLGGQWAPFMQELALKHGRAPSLKITAFVSPSTHDPLELGLIKDNLSLFAANLNISFEFGVMNLDSLDTLYASLNILEKEAIAVNFPLGPTSNSVSSLLNFIKQLNPKIVVTVERGSDRSDLPFSHHIVHALQSYTMLFDSLDATNVNSGALQKIERFLLYPRIESIVTWRRRAGDKMLSWRHLLASAGFSPIPFSNFTETQAECIVKKLQVRGFQVEKHQSSLYLLWQRGELVSISAWRC